jgi:acetyltransferase-like isoleucine patch superfamily enzyme/acyl carrier protein
LREIGYDENQKQQERIEKRLAAYYVSEERPTTSDLRAYLSQKLPGYMIPSYFVKIEKIPLTPNGKVDRKALPKPEGRPELTEDLVAPRSPVERELARIWRKVLGIDQVGIYDDFFDLGGNSLATMRLSTQIEETFGQEISLVDFFPTPTIEQLGKILSEEESLPPQPSQAKIRPAGSKRMKDTLWSGLKSRLLQIIALYAPGAKTTRVWLHRKRGVKVGNGTFIGPDVIIDLAFPKLVSIGDNVAVGIRSVIVAHFKGTAKKAWRDDEPSVRIEDNAFLGPGVIILPNVTIGQGAVVTAGSVVSESVPPLTMVQGNPAKPIARCGVPLMGNSYEQFISHLKPIKD